MSDFQASDVSMVKCKSCGAMIPYDDAIHTSKMEGQNYVQRHQHLMDYLKDGLIETGDN